MFFQTSIKNIKHKSHIKIRKIKSNDVGINNLPTMNALVVDPCCYITFVVPLAITDNSHKLSFFKDTVHDNHTTQSHKFFNSLFFPFYSIIKLVPLIQWKQYYKNLFSKITCFLFVNASNLVVLQSPSSFFFLNLPAKIAFQPLPSFLL